MSEYIGREAVFDEIRFQRELAVSDGEASVVDTCDAMLHNLRKIETADVQPVKHGKWEMNSDYPDRLICNQCNSTYDVYFCKRDSMHYCPNCGSKNRMDGDSE